LTAGWIYWQNISKDFDNWIGVDTLLAVGTPKADK
jgi:hypothetical protein